MIWDCIELTTCENSFDRRRQFKNKLNIFQKSWQHQPMQLFNVQGQEWIDYHIWGDVVTRYTQCDLSYPEKDKLLAISGVARALSIATHDKYLAGLWRKQLPQQLDWSCHSSVRCSRAQPYRAPSWSWASIDGPVGFPTYAIDENRKRISVIDGGTDTELLDPEDPFGPVTNGRIQLVGILVKFVYSRYPKGPTEHHGWLGSSHCNILPDEKPFEDNSTLCCLLITMEESGIQGLLVERSRSGENGRYVRIGRFSVLYNNQVADVKEYKKAFIAACQTAEARTTITKMDVESVEDDSPEGYPRYRITLV
jgi:hypothetical protein